MRGPNGEKRSQRACDCDLDVSFVAERRGLVRVLEYAYAYDCIAKSVCKKFGPSSNLSVINGQYANTSETAFLKQRSCARALPTLQGNLLDSDCSKEWTHVIHTQNQKAYAKTFGQREKQWGKQAFIQVESHVRNHAALPKKWIASRFLASLIHRLVKGFCNYSVLNSRPTQEGIGSKLFRLISPGRKHQAIRKRIEWGVPTCWPGRSSNLCDNHTSSQK
eukprot:1791096-Rhodomonas_salina.2